jgi:hypothetical protein
MFGCRSSPTRRRNEQWCSDPRLPRSSVPRKRKRAGRLELVEVGAVPELIATSFDLLTPTIIMSGGGGGGDMGGGDGGFGGDWREGRGADYFGKYGAAAAAAAQATTMDAVAATTKRSEKLLQQPLFARAAAAATAAAARPPFRVRPPAAAVACARVGDVSAAEPPARITPARFCFGGGDDVFGDGAAPLPPPSSLSSCPSPSPCRALSQPPTPFRLGSIIKRHKNFPHIARQTSTTLT